MRIIPTGFVNRMHHSPMRFSLRKAVVCAVLLAEAALTMAASAGDIVAEKVFSAPAIVAISSVAIQAETVITTTDLYSIVEPSDQGAKVHPENIRTISWISQGPFSKCQQTATHADRTTPYEDILSAYNGRSYQKLIRLANNTLEISKTPRFYGVEARFNPFTWPYRFLVPEKGKDRLGNYDRGVLELQDLRYSQWWARLQNQAKIIGPTEKNGFKCIAFEIDGGTDDILQRPCRFRVWIAPQMGCLPIAWEEYLSPDWLIESYEVVEMGAVKNEGGKVVLKYPIGGKGTRYNYKPPKGGVITQTYEIKSVAVNQPIDASEFTIDIGLATSIHDLDTNRDISLKK